MEIPYSYYSIMPKCNKLHGNEFSSTIASAIICLATNQKFNFSKYIFESMVKNLDNVGKFLMYPRFVQVFLDKQVDGMASHKRIYIAPSHTKKIFGNMRRVGKGFSGRETPLFQIMVKQRLRRSKRKDTQVPQSSIPSDNVANEAVNEEMDDSLVRAVTIASSLEAEQDSGNIDKTQSKATLNEPSSSGTSSGTGPRCQETIRDTIAQTRSKNVSKLSNDPLLSSDSCFEDYKDKKLERRNKLRTHRLKRLYRVGSSRRVESFEDEGLGVEDASADIDVNEDIYLVNVHIDEDMFSVNDLDGDEVIVESVDVVKTTEETRSMVEEVTAVTILVSSATTTTTAITDVEMTLAQVLAELKSAKPKATTITTTQTAATIITAVSTRPRAKGLVIYEQEQAPTPIVSSQQPSQVKAKIDADYQLAQRLQAQEQDELTDEEKARFLKRAGEELEQESSKKKKLEEDKEFEELKQCLKVIPDDGDDVTIDAIPLSTKSPTIVDWKIHKEGKKSYYQIIRADGSSKMYRVFSQMLKSFDRQDLEDLYKLVKAKYGSTRPVEDLDLILYRYLKTMFGPHVKDQVWKNQDDNKVLDWKLYDSCRVHSLRMQHVYIHMLVEKRYPLTQSTIIDMLNKNLQGRIVRIKRLLDDLRVTAAQLMLLVYKLLLLVLKVNAASTKVTTAQRLRLLKEFLLSEKG
ncbi:hypothetical protein Tco_0236741 [Tanacetum coccineum]